MIGIQELERVLDRVRPFTMTSVGSLVDLARLVDTILICDIPGSFVECGVWRGGSSFLMADLLRVKGVRDRKVWMFDSFEGMPEPEEIDGRAALAWAERKEHSWYLRNLTAPLEEVQRVALELGLAERVRFVKGWFEDTLPANRGALGPISILRIDCDWYSGVRCCLQNLYDQVTEGGFVILDDYYTYDGCAIAVHEFLGARRLGHRIERGVVQWQGREYYYPARFYKGDKSWEWRYGIHLTRHEIATLISSEEPFILVDEGRLGDAVAPGHRAIPFPERDGRYWGLPADDAAAIREVKRLREVGANFLIFAWPAFWWLDHYTGLYSYLRSTARCVRQNEYVIAFDLRQK